MIEMIRYWITETFFEKELDEAYAMGIREGRNVAMAKISFATDVKYEELKMTKTQKVGYDMAREVIAECREEIKRVIK